MGYELKVWDKRYNLKDLVEFHLSLEEAYNRILKLNHTVILSKTLSKKAILSEYIRIKEEIIYIYDKYTLNIKKEFSKFAEDFRKYLYGENHEILDVKYRIKTLPSLLEKVIRSSIKIEPGKSQWISDFTALRAVVGHEECAYELANKIENFVNGHPEIAFYLETPLTRSAHNTRENKNIRLPEMEFLYGSSDKTITWKGVVIDGTSSKEKTYVHIFKGISPREYGKIRSKMKKIGKRIRTKEIGLQKYIIEDLKIREEFRSKYIMVYYDNYNSTLFIFIPERDKGENDVIAEKDILQEVINKGRIDMYKTISKNITFRPHYGLNKIDIPILLSKLGFKVKRYNPWEIIDLPHEHIVRGCEGSFYSCKIAYMPSKTLSVPLTEIQILGKEYNSLFLKGKEYNHETYKQKERAKTLRAIKALAEKSSRKKAKIIEKVLREVYKMYRETNKN